MKFEPFPKIPRLNKNMTITEKIDGTNAQIMIDDIGPADNRNGYDPHGVLAVLDDGVRSYTIKAGSRKRLITPEKDNFGFAKWVQDNAYQLVALGAGRHFGEWWGKGIQRGYGLSERRFSLFNAGRWLWNQTPPPCCHVVPVLYHGKFDLAQIENVMELLREAGSSAVPGYDNPEGVIIFYENHLYKDTFKYREGKWNEG
jgi:hypothetical protein